MVKAKKTFMIRADWAAYPSQERGNFGVSLGEYGDLQCLLRIQSRMISHTALITILQSNDDSYRVMHIVLAE